MAAHSYHSSKTTHHVVSLKLGVCLRARMRVLYEKSSPSEAAREFIKAKLSDLFRLTF